jgi:Tol biopolymer transport system component
MVTQRLFQIVRVEASTGSQEVMLEDARDAAFSPDGGRVAYLRYEASLVAFSLHLAAPDGSEDRELLGPGAFSDLAVPRFSPDGKQLVFAGLGGPVTDEQGYPRRSSRSPLDALLSLLPPPAAEAHGALWDIWVINVDGSGLRRLPGVREDAPMALFMPDGQQIVMMGSGGISLMNRDGSNLRKIDPLGDHGGFDWAGP